MTRRPLEGLDEDIRDHIERETQDHIDRGMTPEDARDAALRKFGNVTLTMEETRAVWIPVWLDQLLQDLRYGLRMLRRTPAFSAVVILTLAVGIGLSAAVFSVVTPSGCSGSRPTTIARKAGPTTSFSRRSSPSGAIKPRPSNGSPGFSSTPSRSTLAARPCRRRSRV